MKLERYGITLRRLEEQDLELVRLWRNADHVNRHMIFREYITPEMQQAWFSTINNYNNFYYIIEFKNKKIGLINNKNTDWDMGTAESGLFVADTDYFDTWIPVAASLILTEIGFYLLGGKDAYIHVKKDNIKAIEYNTKLGFELQSEENEILTFSLTKPGFEKNATRIKKAMKDAGMISNPYLVITLQLQDFETGVGEKVEEVLSALPQEKIIRKYYSQADKIWELNI